MDVSRDKIKSYLIGWVIGAMVLMIFSVIMDDKSLFATTFSMLIAVLTFGFLILRF